MQARGALMLLGASFFWGTTFVAQMSGMDGLGPFSYAAARYFLGFLSLLAVLIWTRKSRARERRAEKLSRGFLIGLACGIFLFAASSMQQISMLYTTAAQLGSSILPSVSLSMFTMASIARFTRTEMLEVLGSDYMLLAESKGVSGFSLIFRHALRNALIPIITVLAPLIVDLMTGSLVVEKIFAIPGVGSLLVNAIQSNDYNVVISLSFIIYPRLAFC